MLYVYFSVSMEWIACSQNHMNECGTYGGDLVADIIRRTVNPFIAVSSYRDKEPFSNKFKV